MRATQAETLKADGNRALGGNFSSLAAGLYTKAIAALEPLASGAAAAAGPAAAADDPIIVALASYYSNRS